MCCRPQISVSSPMSKDNQLTADPLRGWSEPTPELINRALSRIGHWQHRRVFFERLENPRWVEALEARGSFRAPSKASSDPSDETWWPRWPEGEYLVRMAPLVPDAVARIMLRESSSENFFVHEVVLRAALMLPTRAAEQLAPAIRDYILGGTVRDSEAVVELIEKLSEAGSAEAASAIADAAFRPRRLQQHETTAQLKPPSVAVGVDQYWYEELLPRALEALDHAPGTDALATATGWLKEFQEVSGEFNRATNTDVSVVWRPSIGNHPQNTRFVGIGDSLVEAVRDHAIDAVRKGRPVDEVLAVLEVGGQPLLSRIAMHVLSEVADGNDEACASGFRLLVDPEFVSYEYRHEYSELARQLLPEMSEGQAEEWASLILDGSPPSRIVGEQEAVHIQQLDEDLGDEIRRRYKDQWQLNVLSAIGAEVLPNSAKLRLAELIEEFGEPEHADFPVFMSPVVRPASPAGPEELRSLSVDDIRQLLTNLDTGSEESSSQSRSALGHVLQVVVSERPTEFSAAAGMFADLSPTFVRALMAGLSDAVPTGALIDWAATLQCVSATTHRRDDDSEPVRRMDEDVLWKTAQLSAAALVKHGATGEAKNGIPLELLGIALDAIAPLVEHPDPTPAFEERFGGSNLDPRTLSLNTIRPAAIRAIAQLAVRARIATSDSPAEPHASDVIKSALDLLGKRLRPVRDESLAVAAAFGDTLPSLMWVDVQWAEAHVGFLLTADRFGEIVLSTALANWHPSRSLIDLVTPAAKALLDRASAGEIAASGSRTGRTPAELIGDRALWLHVQDAIPADHPLLRHFFNVAPVEARSSVLGHLGWLIMNAEGIPEDALQRAMSLWDGRSDAVRSGSSEGAELSGFDWWVRAGKFDPSWWLPRLEEVASSQTFDPHSMLGAPLEAAAEDEPQRAVAILDHLLSGRDKALGRYDLIRHAPGILAAALDSGDAAAVAKAKKVMNYLGRSGHVRLAETVEQRRGRR